MPSSLSITLFGTVALAELADDRLDTATTPHKQGRPSRIV
jgi:hypothetical protein